MTNELQTATEDEIPPFQHMAALSLGMVGFGVGWLLPVGTTDVEVKEIVYQRMTEMMFTDVGMLFDVMSGICIVGGLLFVLVESLGYAAETDQEPRRGPPTAAPVTVAIFEAIWPALFALPTVFAGGLVYLTLNSTVMAGMMAGIVAGASLPQAIEMYQMTQTAGGNHA